MNSEERAFNYIPKIIFYHPLIIFLIFLPSFWIFLQGFFSTIRTYNIASITIFVFILCFSFSFLFSFILTLPLTVGVFKHFNFRISSIRFALSLLDPIIYIYVSLLAKYIIDLTISNLLLEQLTYSQYRHLINVLWVWSIYSLAIGYFVARLINMLAIYIKIDSRGKKILGKFLNKKIIEISIQN